MRNIAQNIPSQDPNVLARLHRITQFSGVDIPLLAEVEEEDLVVPSLVERFHEALRDSTWSAVELAKEIVQERGEIGLLEALALPVRLGDVDSYLLRQIFNLRPELLDRLAGADENVVGALVPLIARAAFESRRPLKRGVVFDKLLSLEVSPDLALGLVTDLDEEYGRDNLTGSLSFDQVSILVGLYEGEESFRPHLRSILTSDATTLVLEGKTRGAARLAYQIGTVDVSTIKTILDSCTSAMDVLSLYNRAIDDMRDARIERALVAAKVAQVVAEHPVDALDGVKSSEFYYGVIHKFLLEEVPLSEDLVVECLDRTDVHTICRWGMGRLKHNPFDASLAKRWVEQQDSLDYLVEVISVSAERSPLIEVIVKHAKGFATVLTEAFNLDGSVEVVTKTIPHVGAVLGSNEELWKRLIDADESSPYGNERLTFPEATQVYLGRWAEKAKRTQA